MLGFALAKAGRVCVPGGFRIWGAGSPPSAPCSSIQAPGGGWAVGVSASPSVGVKGSRRGSSRCVRTVWGRGVT